MRAALRLLATATGTVRPSARFLKPGSPTGLTGLGTHPSPRSALLYLYNHTLDKLKQIPEHSLYRQSAEALTKHRLAIVEQYVPEGYEAWQERARKLLQKYKADLTARQFDGQHARLAEGPDGRAYFIRQMVTPQDWRDVEWDGAVLDPHFSWVQTGESSVGSLDEEDVKKLWKVEHGVDLDEYRTAIEKKDKQKLEELEKKRKNFVPDPIAVRTAVREVAIKLGAVVADRSPVEWESEPPLSAEQWVFFPTYPCG